MATIQQCNRALRRLPEFTQAEAQKTIDVTAFQVARLASARAPQRTGRLAVAITWKSLPRSLSAMVGIERDAFYWKYFEYGTVKMAARPIFRPAASAMAEDHSARMLAGLERALTQMERSV